LLSPGENRLAILRTNRQIYFEGNPGPL
jgi:hypothetical protein